MAKKSEHLTESEEELMELFWSRKEALTSVEILKMDFSHSWSDSYLHIMLRSLMKKKMIEVCGTVQYGTQYARQFVPSMTKEEYVAKIITEKGVDKSSLAKVAVAMVKETDVETRADLIEELEKIIRELKEKTSEE